MGTSLPPHPPPNLMDKTLHVDDTELQNGEIFYSGIVQGLFYSIKTTFDMVCNHLVD